MKITRLISSIVAVSLTVFILTVVAFNSFAQTSTSNTIPTVIIYATNPDASFGGQPGTFYVYREGNTVPALNVYYCISGTASNGVDYQAIGNIVSLPSGVISNSITINPINNGQSNVETVVIDLCPSPLMTPVNYAIGSPNEAIVYISPVGTTNLPPAVRMANPTNNEIYHAPVDIGLIAQASDPDGVVTNVEFFAGTTDLGPGHQVVLDPPGANGITGLVYYFDWANVPPNTYSLTAVATDNGGASTVSAPVKITVLGAGSNLPPIVRITSPPNGAVYRAPSDIPIFSYAADLNGFVTSVQFFENGNSLGYGKHVTAIPPPVPPGGAQPPILIVTPTNSWVLVWTNPPPGTNIILTAQATDNGGLSATSAPVAINILPPLPPPTNRPPFIAIVATDPVAIEGTNCWPWLGLVSPTATWTAWTSPTATFCLRTNCGPKDATFTVFRLGATNDDINVNYAIGGSATNGVDYVALPGTVLISAGQRSTVIPIIPIDDGPPDITSSVILKITPGTNYLVGYPAAAAAIILDSNSPKPTPIGIVPGNLFHICSTGPNGAWFHVERSTDLLNWTPICTNQVVNGSIDFIDPDAATQSGAYYRTVPELNAPLQ